MATDARGTRGFQEAWLSDFEERDYRLYWKERALEDASQKHIIRNWATPAKRFLEMGGGFGRITKVLESSFTESVLIELSSRNANYARLWLKKTSLLRADVQLSPMRDSSFDCIVMVRVAHLLPDPRAVMEEIYRLAKDGATVIVSIPNQAMVAFFMKVGRFGSKSDRESRRPPFLHAVWPYGEIPYLLAPLEIFPRGLRLVGIRGTGVFENRIGRFLNGRRLLYLLDVATSFLWMFKLEIFLKFKVEKAHEMASRH